jgi:hypothetical protein
MTNAFVGSVDLLLRCGPEISNATGYKQKKRDNRLLLDSQIWVLAHKVRRRLPTNAFKGSKYAYLLLRCDPEVETPRDEKKEAR